jgi:limonene-1,2-epoxide hydrolase
MVRGDDVPEERIESIVRGFGEAFVKRDVEKMLSFFSEDAVWVSPVGTFKGKEGLRQVLTWDTQISPIVKSKPSGIGIIVKGNKAVTEDISEGLYEGKKYETLAVTVFEFSDDKIQHIRLFYDKLSIIKQVTMQYKGVTGWFAKRLINYIVGRGEKGLR